LDFRLVEEKPKTKVYEVWNTMTDCLLGVIKWDSAWRHYCWFQENDIKMSDRCMIKIGGFVKDLNEAHKGNQYLSIKTGEGYEKRVPKRKW
jgi:hypothetical protein